MIPGLAALRALEGRTIERIGCIGTGNGSGDGEDLILSMTIRCTDGFRVNVTPQFWAEGDMPWVEISEGRYE